MTGRISKCDNKIARTTLLLLFWSLFILPGCVAVTQPEPALKLYVFNCGRIDLDDKSLGNFGLQASDTAVRRLIVPCYMIEHPKGRLLWDGGLPSAQVDKPLALQLAAMGLGMDSFDYMVFSHSHSDHVGVANEVRGATLLIQKQEYEAAFAPEVNIPFFMPELYASFRDAKRIMLDGDYDVFGDGRVRIIAAPGHTPGHQMLYLDLAESGPMLLSGDLYHFQVSRQKKAVPLFNTDPAETLHSMEKIEALITRTGADLWIEHDLARFQSARKAPDYYQ